MFGTMGFSELILILVIILIIFGAGRLPQIGEGVGKALRSFKKEVHDAPPPDASGTEMGTSPQQSQTSAAADPPSHTSPPPAPRPLAASVPGPEMTPGTTASMLYQAGPESPQRARTAQPQEQQSSTAPDQHVVSMEERAAAPVPPPRAQYPPLPAGSRPRQPVKRPSAIVNKEAVARVQAQQAALKAKATKADDHVSPQEMQQMGANVGDLVRTFRQAAADVRESIAPHAHTIQTELDAAQKELQQSLDAARQSPPVQEDRSRSS
jgi:TatA/E family protein of Tat protein translocase